MSSIIVVFEIKTKDKAYSLKAKVKFWLKTVCGMKWYDSILSDSIKINIVLDKPYQQTNLV